MSKRSSKIIAPNHVQRGTDENRKGFECIQLNVLSGKTTLSTAEQGPKMILLRDPRCIGPALPAGAYYTGTTTHAQPPVPASWFLPPASYLLPPGSCLLLPASCPLVTVPWFLPPASWFSDNMYSEGCGCSYSPTWSPCSGACADRP